MSTRQSPPNELNSRAAIFAALGDPTRLALLNKLCDGHPHSISRLTKGADMTRQAMTKHLHVLAEAGLLENIRVGRESRFVLVLRPLEIARAYLDDVSCQWDAALFRLKAHVES